MRLLSFVRILVTIIMPFSLLFGAALAKACDLDNRPKANQNNIWFCYSGSNTVFVFVHGVLSDSKDAWFNVDQDLYWPEIILNDQLFEQPSIFMGGYFTEFDGGDYGIRQASQELMSALYEPLNGHPPVMSKRNIIFLTHSTGGIVTRHLLVENAERFKEKKVGVVLIASPSGGSKYATYLKSLNALVRNRIGRELEWSHPFLEELDRRFQSLVGRQRIEALIGKELVEHEFITANVNFFGAWLLDHFLKWSLPQVVEINSAARYFPDPQIIPYTNHINIVKPDGMSHATHRALRQFFLSFKQMAAPDCKLDYGAHIKLNVTHRSSDASAKPADDFFGDREFFPMIATRRVRPDGKDGEIRPYAKTSGRYDLHFAPPIPCPGDRYEEKFRLVWPTQLRMTDEGAPTELCFQRSNAQESFAALDCREGDKCVPDQSTPGMARACDEAAFRWPDLIATAHAAGNDTDEFRPEEPYWSLPSIDTFGVIPRDQRPGYAQIAVTSESLSRMPDATQFSYGVKVNGVSLWFDGWPPHSDKIAFSPEQGVHQAFALEDLAFTGGDDGYETIAVDFRLYNAADEELAQLTTKRPYSAFAKLRQPWNQFMERHTVDEGAAFTWRGTYVPSVQRGRYEVTLASWTSDSDMERARRYAARARSSLDSAQKDYKGRSVVGRIVPPRPDSPAYGLSFAVKLQSGQIVSMFSLDEAKAVCQWVLDNQNALRDAVAEDPYIYDSVPSNFSERGDRGRYAGTCSSF